MLTPSVASYLADLFGRRVGVCVGIVVLAVGTVLQGMHRSGRWQTEQKLTPRPVVPTANRGMYIGGRFLVGMGSASSRVALPDSEVLTETTARTFPKALHLYSSWSSHILPIGGS